MQVQLQERSSTIHTLTTEVARLREHLDSLVA
eukprot:SAG31_NODE_6348_length_2052_cov_5.239424_1_plen_31_part_10